MAYGKRLVAAAGRIAPARNDCELWMTEPSRIYGHGVAWKSSVAGGRKRIEWVAGCLRFA